MISRELWRNPKFRMSLRTLVMWGAGGLLIGLGWGLIGRRLPPGWSEVWSLAFCGMAAAAALYMMRDMRRMDKERIRMQRELDRMIAEAETVIQQTREESAAITAEQRKFEAQYAEYYRRELQRRREWLQ